MAHPPFPHERIDRALHRTTHTVDKVARRGRPPAFLGLLLVAMGVLFLLDNLNIVEGRYLLRTYWPTLIIAWGMLRLIFGRGHGRVLGLLVMLVGSALLANNMMRWGIEPWDLLWPLALIAFGLHVLVQATMPRASWEAEWTQTSADDGTDDNAPPQPPPDPDMSATVKETVVTGSAERRNASQTFRGGELTAVLGSLELDLHECRMAEGVAELNVFVNLGNVELRIPRDWSVESHVSVMLANFENHSQAPVDPTAKRLILRGYAFLGNIEISN